MRQHITLIALFSMLFLTFSPLIEVSSARVKSKYSVVIASSASTAGEGSFALLVGINKYIDSSINNLSGCENDVKMMKGLLMSQYGFTEDKADKKNSGIRTLISAAATRDAILQSFQEQLVDKAELYFKDKKLSADTRDKGATIVFYYSGHGATLPDLDKAGNLAFEEPDGLDETIVPYDAKGDGTNAIRDDEFDVLFRQLSNWTTNITFIFDSCHSGTVTRAPEGIRRTEFAYVLPKPAEEELRRLQSSGRSLGDNTKLTDSMDDFRTQSRGGGQEAGYVTLSGCLPNQLSQERYLDKGSRNPNDDKNGLLTHFLVLELKRNPAGTYRDIMKNVQIAVSGKNPSQTPQFEGDIDRPVFNIAPGSDTSSRQKAIGFKNSGVAADEDGKNFITVELEAGTLVGAMEGGVIAVYTKDAPVLSGDNKRIGTGTIESSSDFSSTAKITLTGNGSKVPDDALISLVTPYFGTARQVIALDAGNRSTEVMKKLAGLALDKNENYKDFFKTVEVPNPLKAKLSDRRWEAAVVRLTYGEFKLGNEQAKTKDLGTPSDEDDVYMLADTNGMPLYNFYVQVANPAAAREIANALEKHVRVKNMRAFGNGAGGINDQLKLELVPITPSKSGSAPCVLAERPDSERINKSKTEILNPEQWIYFKITNNSGNPMYVYLYDIAQDGSVNWIYPDPRLNASVLLESKRSVNTLLPNNCPYIRISQPGQTSAPYGIETYKLIASTTKINGKLLESPAIARGSRAGSSALEQLLSRASTNVSTRGEIDNTFEFSGWGTTSIDIDIRPKNGAPRSQ